MKKSLLVLSFLVLSTVNAYELTSVQKCVIAMQISASSEIVKANALTNDQETNYLTIALGEALGENSKAAAFEKAATTYCSVLNAIAIEVKK